MGACHCRTSLSELSVLQDITLWTVCTAGHCSVNYLYCRSSHSVNYLYCRILLSELSVLLDITQWTICTAGPLSELSVLQDIAHWSILQDVTQRTIYAGILSELSITIYTAGHHSVNYLYCRTPSVNCVYCTSRHHSVNYLYCGTLLSELCVLQEIAWWAIYTVGHHWVNYLYCRTSVSELSVLRTLFRGLL